MYQNALEPEPPDVQLAVSPPSIVTVTYVFTLVVSVASISDLSINR